MFKKNLVKTKGRRLPVLAMAAMLAAGTLAPMMPARALELPSCELKVVGDDGSLEFAGYRLMNVTVSGSGNDTKYAYYVNNTYKTILETIVGDQDGNKVFDHRDVQSYLEAKDRDVQKFADDVYKAILADKTITPDITIEPSEDSSTVQRGYYLVAESSVEDWSSYSVAMLDTAGLDTVTISVKKSVPELNKYLTDSKGEEIDNANMVTLDDTVKFTIEGTLPSNLDSYDTYRYVITDFMEKGLVLDKDSIKVMIGDTPLVKDTDYTLDFDAPSAATAIATPNNMAFSVSFDDIKKVAGVTKDTTITVTYSAVVTMEEGIMDSMVSGGLENGANLEFSNNPYDVNGKGTTIIDEDSTTHSYACRLGVSKTDGENPLPGASFKIQKKQADGSWKDMDESASDMNEDGTEFYFFVLGEGDYKLVEVSAPDGYSPADDIEFTISAEFEKQLPAARQVPVDRVVPVVSILQDGKPADGEGGIFQVGDVTITTEVVNVAGNRLPATGGSGTAGIMAAGCMLFAGGCVILFAKKRKDEKQKA